MDLSNDRIIIKINFPKHYPLSQKIFNFSLELSFDDSIEIIRKQFLKKNDFELPKNVGLCVKESCKELKKKLKEFPFFPLKARLITYKKFLKNDMISLQEFGEDLSIKAKIKFAQLNMELDLSIKRNLNFEKLEEMIEKKLKQQNLFERIHCSSKVFFISKDALIDVPSALKLRINLFDKNSFPVLNKTATIDSLFLTAIKYVEYTNEKMIKKYDPKENNLVDEKVETFNKETIENKKEIEKPRFTSTFSQPRESPNFRTPSRTSCQDTLQLEQFYENKAKKKILSSSLEDFRSSIENIQNNESDSDRENSIEINSNPYKEPKSNKNILENLILGRIDTFEIDLSSINLSSINPFVTFFKFFFYFTFFLKIKQAIELFKRFLPFKKTLVDGKHRQTFEVKSVDVFLNNNFKDYTKEIGIEIIKKLHQLDLIQPVESFKLAGSFFLKKKICNYFYKKGSFNTGTSKYLPDSKFCIKVYSFIIFF